MNSQDSRPVVVGFDGSQLATQAVEWAARAARRREAPLVVLSAANHAHYIPDAAVGVYTPEMARRSAMATAERGVAVAQAIAPEVAVRPEVSLASAAAALEDISAQARQVVVGNSGHGRVAGVLLGSTAFHITTHADCPVIVVPGDQDNPLPGPGARVSVATDGSPVGDQAVDYAAEVAAYYDAPLEVLTSWHLHGFDRHVTSPEAAAAAESVDWQAIAENIAQTASERAARAQPGLGITWQAPEGRAAEALTGAAADAALLVLGARGRGDFKSLLLGSTTRAVLHLATVPVAVIR